jgi:hypothetical protein
VEWIHSIAFDPKTSGTVYLAAGTPKATLKLAGLKKGAKWVTTKIVKRMISASAPTAGRESRRGRAPTGCGP